MVERRVASLISLPYEVQGQGSCLLFLHGFGGGPSDWRELATAMSTEYKTFIPNLKSFFAGSQPLSMSEQVERLSCWLDEVLPAGEAVHLVGASFGGTLAYRLQQKRPDRIRSLVLINPMPVDPLRKLRNRDLRLLMRFRAMPRALRLLLRLHWGKQMLLRLAGAFRLDRVLARVGLSLLPRHVEVILKAVDKFVWLVSNENWASWMSLAKPSPVPGLIICTSQDPLFAIADLQSLGHGLECTQLVVIDDNAHVLSRSAVNELSSAFRNFFTRLDEVKEPLKRCA